MTEQAISVDHFCTYPFGGAATAARRLHEGLKLEGLKSRFKYHERPETTMNVSTYAPLQFQNPIPNPLTRPIVKKIKRLRRKQARADYREHLENRPEGYEVFSPTVLFDDTTPARGELSADIINLHWMAFFVDYPTFFQSIPNKKPVVWTLHDMNPFTGGCHYTTGCGRFTQGCGACPQVSNSGPNDISKRAFQLKKKLYRHKNLTVVTPSRWLSREAQRSHVFSPKTRFEVIPYGLETEVYHPVNKPLARHELGIPDDELIISFGAEDLKNRRKGMDYLWQALEQIEAKRPVSALLFGAGEPEHIPSRLKSIYKMGYVEDVDQKAKIYSAADIFIMPSLEDNQPQTGLEAMACGTPVVAFDAGGVPEYVRSGLTGLVAKVADADDLAKQLSWVLQHDQARVDMGRQARAMIESEFPLHLQAQRYQGLYEELLGIQSVSTRAAA